MFLWTVGLLASSQRKHGGDARVRRRKKNSAKTCVAAQSTTKTQENVLRRKKNSRKTCVAEDMAG